MSGVSGLVSVVMPVRNEERSVERAVLSVLEQSYQPIEVVVIDAESEDGTIEIIESLIEQGAPLRYFTNPRRLIAAGLNVGLEHARGEFIARVDAHAEVNREYLEVALQHLRHDPHVVAVGGRRRGVAETSVGRANALALSSPFGVGNSINHYATEVQRTDHASFGVYRAEAARAVGGWDVSLVVNEDVDFDHRLMQHGWEIVYDPTMIIDWHVRESVRDLGRQYRRYGRGKAAMVRKNGAEAVRPRHLAAPLVVTALSLAGVSVLTGHPRVAAALTLPYCTALVAASALTWRNAESSDLAQLSTLPASFAAMHTGWGVGFLEGLTGRQPAMASQRE